jgi:hypothetical protein
MTAAPTKGSRKVGRADLGRILPHSSRALLERLLVLRRCLHDSIQAESPVSPWPTPRMLASGKLQPSVPSASAGPSFDLVRPKPTRTRANMEGPLALPLRLTAWAARTCQLFTTSEW